MVDDKLCSDMAEDLRKQAEERTNKTQTWETLSPEEASSLLHELQVHQIELEMQNDELRRVQVKLEASRARYFELYDLAPVGYFTISEQGLILEANLTVTALLGVTRGNLSQCPLSSLILPEDQDIYYLHRKQLLANGTPQVCELRMRRTNADPFWARLDLTVAKDVDDALVFRGVVSDITERKQAQEIIEHNCCELEQRVKERTAELAAANKQLRAEVEERKQGQEALRGERQTLSHLLRASDQERQAIAYEIHDELAQQLSGALMQFQAFEALKDTNPTLAINAYNTGINLLNQGYCEARRLIAGVRPPILDESGIVAAVGHLVNEQRLNQEIEFEYRHRVRFERLAPMLENAIYRVAQEAVANASRHSKSSKVRVSLVQKGNRIRITIRDWGVGFDLKTTQENRFGLEGIRQRARLLGGKCNVLSIVSKGTCISVELPLCESEAGYDVPV